MTTLEEVLAIWRLGGEADGWFAVVTEVVHMDTTSSTFGSSLYGVGHSHFITMLHYRMSEARAACGESILGHDVMLAADNFHLCTACQTHWEWLGAGGKPD